MRTLQDKVVFVTGGSSGIGEGIVRRLGADGTRVGVGFYHGEDEAQAIVRDVEEAGGQAVAIGGNMAKEADVAAAYDQLERAYGRVDGAVLNAGVQADAAFAEMSLDDWRKVMAIDLDGAFLTAREAVRRMDAQDRLGGARSAGGIVFVSSVHQHIPWAGHVNYAAAKGGVKLLMQSLAQEVASRGIRVNAIAPGAIETPINEDVWSDEEARAALLKLIPYGRLGCPEDVAAAAAWLLSDEADYVTGTTLTVDGGMSLYPSFVGNG